MDVSMPPRASAFPAMSVWRGATRCGLRCLNKRAEDLSRAPYRGIVGATNSIGDVVTETASFAPTAGTWARRATVLGLIGLAGFLMLGPSVDVVTKFVAPAALLMTWRAIQRGLPAKRPPHLRPARMSKRDYAIVATLAAALFSLPLWILCNKAWIAITLIPALVCIWFAVYLFRDS